MSEKSRQLLDQTKRAVELYIEEGEDAANRFIKSLANRSEKASPTDVTITPDVEAEA